METLWRILMIVGILAASHVAVRLMRALSTFLMEPKLRLSPKFRTLTSLISSLLIFALYFGAIGFVLTEFGVSLTAYLASATVIGLAIGFGLQGLVQDVITGLTLIFSRLLDVGRMVEISGQSGVVRHIGMRFVVLENSMGARIHIPNRTITNVIDYPKGYVRCMVDITLPAITDAAVIEKSATEAAASLADQFPGLFVMSPSIERIIKTDSGRSFLRIKFRIWPGRGAVIEGPFRQEMLQKMKTLDPTFADWMITVNYEVERKFLPAGR